MSLSVTAYSKWTVAGWQGTLNAQLPWRWWNVQRAVRYQAGLPVLAESSRVHLLGTVRHLAVDVIVL
jgi:hypothetical protein